MVNNREEKKRIEPILNEDDIFKSLGHQVRRDIIKYLGENPLTFTQVKNRLEPIDSPTLSYHMRSLQPLLIQKENKYELSEIGEAAFNLLSKTDQSVRISRYKRKFQYAHIVTILSWVTASMIIPYIIAADLGFITIVSIVIVISVISTINETIIGILRKKY
ncbi:MAG: winged helix-turn-helix domain-containing protein [Candidatus Thorarchaeota archaeon]